MLTNDPAGASRRSFLLSASGLMTTAWVATQWSAISAAATGAEQAHSMADMADIGHAPAWTGFQFFTPHEAQDVDAIAAQIVPSDATMEATGGAAADAAPAAGGARTAGAAGAREAHAVYFIDRSLATYFAAWADEYRAGLREFAEGFKAHALARGVSGPSFAAASGVDQSAFLHTVERTPFFDTTRLLTILGLFSAPKYGGNVDGSGWRIIGFEDRHAFAPPFGYYDARYGGFEPYPT